MIRQRLMQANPKGGELHDHEHYERESCKNGVVCLPKVKTKKLYGMSVPKEKFETLKKLADVLAKETYTNLSLKQARERAVRSALYALILMWEENKFPTTTFRIVDQKLKELSKHAFHGEKIC